MHRGVRLGVQQVDANFLDGLQTEEIDFYLNETIIEFVKDRFSGRTIDGRGFEQSQERTDDLRTLLTKQAELAATFVGSPTDGFFIDKATLPADYLFMVAHSSKIEYDLSGQTMWPSTIGQSRSLLDGGSVSPSVSEKTVLNRPVQSDDIYRLLKDPYNTTYYKEPIADINESNINIYTDDKFIVKQVAISYLRQPAEVSRDIATPANSVDCDLPGHVHNEIVRRTTRAIIAHLGQFQGERA